MPAKKEDHHEKMRGGVVSISPNQAIANAVLSMLLRIRGAP
jgi:hypothetical protein